MTNNILGTGILGTHPVERHTDRHGTVHLRNGGRLVSFDTSLIGQCGELSAVVLRIHSPIPNSYYKHTNIEVVEEGSRIPLGKGVLFAEEEIYAGVKPEDGRETNWLDKYALLLAMGQDVRLEFTPDTRTPA